MSTDLQSDLQTALGEAYRVSRELPGGEMSRVFVAEDSALEREIVVKVLPPDLVAGLNLERFRSSGRKPLGAAWSAKDHCPRMKCAGFSSTS